MKNWWVINNQMYSVVIWIQNIQSMFFLWDLNWIDMNVVLLSFLVAVQVDITYSTIPRKRGEEVAKKKRKNEENEKIYITLVSNNCTWSLLKTPPEITTRSSWGGGWRGEFIEVEKVQWAVKIHANILRHFFASLLILLTFGTNKREKMILFFQ